MALIVEELQPLTAEELAEWRRNVPEGSTREVGPAAPRPGGRSDPDEITSPLGADESVSGDMASLRVPPKEVGRLTEREAVEAYAAHLLRFVRENREWFLLRARMLKATSPLQFSHLTDEQLSDQLVAMVEEKAKAGVERTYNRQGWSRPLDMDLEPTGFATPPGIWLPGQRGT